MPLMPVSVALSPARLNGAFRPARLPGGQLAIVGMDAMDTGGGASKRHHVGVAGLLMPVMPHMLDGPASCTSPTQPTWSGTPPWKPMPAALRTVLCAPSVPTRCRAMCQAPLIWTRTSSADCRAAVTSAP